MKRFETIAAALFGAVFLIQALAVAVETLLRKLFNYSLQGVDELGGYLLACGAALACAVALISRAHIRIDLLHDRLPQPLRIALNGLSLLCIALCAAALLRMAWVALDESLLFNATAQTPWATPLWLPQTAWLGALGIFGAVAVFELVRFARLALAGRSRDLNHFYGPRGSKEELQEELDDLRARGVSSDPVLPLTKDRSP